MGQVLKKFGGGEQHKGPILEECYVKFFTNNKEWTLAEFYHAVCLTVEEINKTIGSTQFRVPKTETLEHAYKKHHQGKGKSLSKDGFQKILQEVIMDSGVTGIGAKDLLIYIFGVPITTLFIKQRIIPKAIPNEYFIPAITSATVFVLAKLKKL
ncbi:hypothetical protein Leryth_009130 [Lithospermum erythrorhizon]|nr:hypothetical protein Leryth_009130 [Lithospermum erythrorhizon]